MGSLLNGTGGTVQVTFVTFLENGALSTIGFQPGVGRAFLTGRFFAGCFFVDSFCAEQAKLFPLDQRVLVNFNHTVRPGSSSGSLAEAIPGRFLDYAAEGATFKSKPQRLKAATPATRNSARVEEVAEKLPLRCKNEHRG